MMNKLLKRYLSKKQSRSRSVMIGKRNADYNVNKSILGRKSFLPRYLPNCRKLNLTYLTNKKEILL